MSGVNDVGLAEWILQAGGMSRMWADFGEKMKASRTLPSSVLRTRGTLSAGQKPRRGSGSVMADVRLFSETLAEKQVRADESGNLTEAGAVAGLVWEGTRFV